MAVKQPFNAIESRFERAPARSAFSKAAKAAISSFIGSRRVLIPKLDGFFQNFLRDGRSLSAAGVDVLSTEPPTANNPLLSAKNCHFTPHIAWATKEARIRLMDIAINNLKAYQNGKPIHVV